MQGTGNFVDERLHLQSTHGARLVRLATMQRARLPRLHPLAQQPQRTPDDDVASGCSAPSPSLALSCAEPESRMRKLALPSRRSAMRAPSLVPGLARGSRAADPASPPRRAESWSLLPAPHPS